MVARRTSGAAQRAPTPLSGSLSHYSVSLSFSPSISLSHSLFLSLSIAINLSFSLPLSRLLSLSLPSLSICVSLPLSALLIMMLLIDWFEAAHYHELLVTRCLMIERMVRGRKNRSVCVCECV